MYRVEYSSAVLDGFALACGTSIALRLAYQWIVPECPVRRSVLLCHGITSSHEAYVAEGRLGVCPDAGWGNGFIGSGCALDPSQGDMILSINAPGSCFGSSCATDMGSKPFPPLTMADMASAHWRLIDQLGIERIDQLIGYSFGGYVAIEMACQQGSRIGALLQLASALQGRSDPAGVAEIKRMIDLPPAERHSAILNWRRSLLERYGYACWVHDRYGPEAMTRLEKEIRRWASAFSLESLLTLRVAAAGFDRRDAVLPMQATLIRWNSDLLFPPYPEGGRTPGRQISLTSRYGHAAPLAEPEKWASFLS
jgi:pimeloyl-ACP methyl ester carboxylesterase